MSWKGRYSPEPLNDENRLHASVRTEVMNLLQNQNLLGSIVPRSIPSDSVVRPLVTELPLAPNDGDEIRFLADATNSRVWHLRYRVSATSYRWEFLGGHDLRDENAGTSMTTTSTTYVDLSTAGPSITVPLAGDYRVQWYFQAQNNTVAAVGYMAIKNGSTATADANGVRGQCAVANHDILAPVGSQEINVPAAGTVLLAQYRTSAGTLTVNNAGTLNPWMTVRPVRVGRI